MIQLKHLPFLFVLPFSTTLYAEQTESLDLQGMSIHGNSELPKSLIIIPWKGSQPGDALNQPFNSLLHESLQPLEREVFLRELDYYEVVHRNSPE
ncbi:hypothetical protein BOW53_06820 [Solemya pervernicosa gill symbiont]|uniref:Uncharacterized protein n=1 Tax=Solemya pervernicosa gill symbiont TaxID=642797 RepID=A0A1T2L6I1_9GAMM|nr:hypothetical protein [Solemya pervernicosa gill symbiont]OOZ40715.1 hypothetical protein BOW53_06820 [Solemya pervernicosa gill symbiont]